MTTTEQLGKHLRDVYFGGNWSWSNFKDQLETVTLEQAMTQVGSLNTIAALTFHIDYYTLAITRVLQGEEINAHDKFSFLHPDFQSELEWRKFYKDCLANGEALAWLIEKLDDEILNEIFIDEKYGTYHRNFLGLIEHTHYHLGQIAVVKKLI